MTKTEDTIFLLNGFLYRGHILSLDSNFMLFLDDKTQRKIKVPITSLACIQEGGDSPSPSSGDEP